MAPIDHRFDRFCRKHPNFAVPRLIQYLLAGTVLVFVLDMVSGGLCSAMLAFIPADIARGQVWRLVTFVVVPAETRIVYFLLEVYFTWWISILIERAWGSGKLTLFYCVGVVLNILAGLLLGGVLALLGIPPVFPTMSIGYLNLSLFFAFATLFPDLQLLLFFILPVKAKWLGWLNAALFAYGILTPFLSAASLTSLAVGLLFSLVQAIPPLLAIANYFLFFWSDITGFFRRIGGRARHRRNPQTIRFQKTVDKTRETRGYLHKCTVCGRTDADSPGLEFRYCSKCEGYHCYCADHINAHQHVR